MLSNMSREIGRLVLMGQPIQTTRRELWAALVGFAQPTRVKWKEMRGVLPWVLLKTDLVSLPSSTTPLEVSLDLG